MLTSKVCIVGDFAVGKTSLAERFVNRHFSEDYLTTVGVRIDTKMIESPLLPVPQKLVVWDVAGTDRFGPVEFAYLRGAAGYLFVADGTRPETLDAALSLNEQVSDTYGAQPTALLVNKNDLDDQWALTEDSVTRVENDFGSVFLTSAKTGSNVDAAFAALAERIARQEIEGP